MNEIAKERLGKPWLANDLIFSFTPIGREHEQLLKIVHGFTEDVRDLIIHNSLNSDRES